MKSRKVMKSLEVLYELRQEMHDKADDSVIERLDEAIKNLELLYETKPNEIDPQEVLVTLGFVLEVISSLATLINMAK